MTIKWAVINRALTHTHPHPAQKSDTNPQAPTLTHIHPIKRSDPPTPNQKMDIATQI